MDARSGLPLFCASEGIDRGYLITKSEHDFGISMLEGRSTRFMKVPAHVFAYVTGMAEQDETEVKAP